MLSNASVFEVLVTAVGFCGLMAALYLFQDARIDRKAQQIRGGESTKLLARNNWRREVSRCLKLVLMTTAGIISVLSAPRVRSRPTWGVVGASLCLIGVEVLLVEGAFRSVLERRELRKVGRRRVGDGKGEVG